LSSTFAELGLPAELTSLLAERGITQPFPIQAATIPDALAGRDVCGRAPTGSGKTLAFGIPMVLQVERAKPKKPRGLVLAPTRELAAQIQEELRPLAKLRGLRVATVYGGIPFRQQLQALRHGLDIVVACPGRLADLVNQGVLDLRDVDVVVIDEADRMADMGFLPEVRRLLDMTSSRRQTLLFSATLDGAVDVLIKAYQRKPARHEVAATEAEEDRAEHLFWRTSHEDRVGLTVGIVQRHESTIVFCRTKRGADRLAKRLSQSGLSAAAIHGDRTQPQRDKALAAFAEGEVQALVATDVAARGIHVDGVECVVHYDPPGDEKDYVHRSGRTARAGAGGVVVSLVRPDDTKAVKLIQRKLGFPEGTTPPGVLVADVSGTPKSAAKPAAPKAGAKPGGKERVTAGAPKRGTVAGHASRNDRARRRRSR
jgi:superfamily II DNA/RNA helicase